MSQGYKLYFELDGDEVQFQNVDADWGGDALDTSASLNPDGSHNLGFSDKDGDLQTLAVSMDTLIKDAFVTAFMANFKPQQRYESLDYSLTYGARSISGTGIFMDNFKLTFNIPGGARLRCNFFNLQSGFGES